MDGIAGSADDFDQIGVVIDWLDACRNCDLPALLDLYADDARLECHCGKIERGGGRVEIEAYWQQRLAPRVPTAFGLEDIMPTANGVVLDYLNHEGKPVRIAFSFTRDGRIRRTRCAPLAQPGTAAGMAGQVSTDR